jgi:hypothetical protein
VQAPESPQTFIRRVTANGTRPAWYLQLDMRNYFISIDKQILFDLLATRYSHEREGDTAPAYSAPRLSVRGPTVCALLPRVSWGYGAD